MLEQIGDTDIIWEELYREEFRTFLIKYQMNTIC